MARVTLARNNPATPRRFNLLRREKEDDSMLIERPDIAKLAGMAGFVLSMGIILSILIRGTLPPL